MRRDKKCFSGPACITADQLCKSGNPSRPYLTQAGVAQGALPGTRVSVAEANSSGSIGRQQEAAAAFALQERSGTSVKCNFVRAVFVHFFGNYVFATRCLARRPGRMCSVARESVKGATPCLRSIRRSASFGGSKSGRPSC